MEEQAHASEARVGELVRATEAAKSELERTKQSLAALEQAPKPVPDTTALDQKTRELQATLAELEASRNFGHQVEDTLNRVNDQKAALEIQVSNLSTEAGRAQQEMAALTKAKEEVQQALAAKSPAPDLSGKVRELEAQLAANGPAVAAAQERLAAATTGLAALKQQLDNATAERTALESQVAQLRQQPVAPSYPDLRDRVHELESAVTEAKRLAAAQPAYPDLSGRVSQLEAKLTAAEKLAEEKPAAPVYPDLSGKVAALEGQITALSATVTASARELAETRDKLALAAKPMAPAYPDLSSRVQELETALAAKPAAPAYPDLSAKVRELEAQVSAGSSVAATAKAEASRAQQEVATLTQVKAGAEQHAAELGSRLTLLEQQNARLVSERSANEAASQRLAELTAERDAARTAQNELGSALTKLEQEKSQLAAAQSFSAEAGTRITELSGKVATAEKQATGFRQERDSLSAKLTELAGNLATLQADRERMQKLLAETGKKLRDSTTDASRIKELETQAAASQSALTAAQAEVGSLQAALTANPPPRLIPISPPRCANWKRKCPPVHLPWPPQTRKPATPSRRSPR